MRELSDLLRPIPGPNPSGADCRYTGVFDGIREARREDPDLPLGAWKSERKIADWRAVVELCSDALIHQTKDLQIAAWLTEGLLHTDGYPGLARGLQLLSHLIDNFWSTVYPRSEDEEAELRAGSLEWLGSRLDLAVKSLSLAPDGIDWFEVERQMTHGSIAVIDSVTRGHYRSRFEELNSCLDALRELDTTCVSHFEWASPRFDGLKTSLETVKGTLKSLIGTMPESDEAVAALAGLDAADSEAQKLAERIRQAKEERQRQEGLRSKVAASSELLRSGRIDEAVARLRVLLAEFPEREEVANLLKHAEMELRANEREDAISKLSETIRVLLDSGRIDEATTALQQACKLCPGEPALQSLMTQARKRLAYLRGSGAALDQVHFTITANSSLEPGKSFELYFWVHLNRQRKAVIDRAKLALGVGKSEEMVVKSEGPVPLARGTVVAARISIDGLTLDPCEKSVLWSGETGCASFVILVPPAAVQHEYRGIASIRVNNCEVARMDFLLRVSRKSGRVPAKVKRHTTAFASYASEDRNAVIARLQGMQKVAPWLKVFMDVVDLRSGERWEDELRQAIRNSDVFYLFWCSHARASEWVDREWRYAYEQRGLEFIDPVPLEASHNAPPPDELKTKHFNDLWTELNSEGHRG